MVWFSHHRSHRPPGSIAPQVDSDGSVRALVLRSLDEMRFHALEALWLVDICDLSYRDAAAAAQVPITVFAERLHDARRELRLSYASSFNV